LERAARAAVLRGWIEMKKARRREKTAWLGQVGNEPNAPGAGNRQIGLGQGFEDDKGGEKEG